MGHRRDDGFGSSFGFGNDPYSSSRVHRHHADERMGAHEHGGERDFGEYGVDRDAEAWHESQDYRGGPYGYERGGPLPARMSGHPADWSPMLDRGGYGVRDYDRDYAGRAMRGTDMGFGERDAERGPYYGKGPKGYKRSDERIREEVCEVISRQGFIDASDVEVMVEAGVVRLVGTVAQRNDKRALEQLVERVHGVDEVRNELRLKRNEVGKGPPSQNGPQGYGSHRNARS